MAANLEIRKPSGHELLVCIHQPRGEVIQFLIVVVGGAIALRILVPNPGPYGWMGIAIPVAAFLWSLYSLTCKEELRFDRLSQEGTLTLSSFLGPSEKKFSFPPGTVARPAWHGAEDDRRVVEIVEPGGEVLLRLPKRRSSFTEAEQSVATADLNHWFKTVK